MDSRFFVYILQSQTTGKFYIGSTQNLSVRLNKHNKGHSLATRGGRPWVLVHSEEYENRTLALKRGKEIKAKKSRGYIISLLLGL